MQQDGTYTIAFDDPGEYDRDMLGGKGFGLVEMTRNGLRVPPGCVVSTHACRHYLNEGGLPASLAEEVLERLAQLERRTGKTFGTGPEPLLLSVRSGAPISMPGMMDTILNVGLGRSAAIALADATGDTRFMADVLFRFHCMYSETVLGGLDVPERAEFDEVFAELGTDSDAGTVYDKVWQWCQDRVVEDVGEAVPEEPRQQLLGAVEAVFRSWNTRRAVTYRDLHAIPHDLGTAVVVQSMVFGNLGADSGSGVAFTRNPVTGEPGLYGEFLSGSQGEDVVAGVRTPLPVQQMAETMPAVYEELAAVCARLESTHNDVMDIEFTVEHSHLYLLQVRAAKRTAQAALRIAADFVDEGIHSPGQALQAVTAEHIRHVQRPGFAPDEVAQARDDGRLLTTGVGAAPGQVSGRLTFDPSLAEERAKGGERVILVRHVTSPTDLHGMIAAAGTVTATGGSTSHAAVVARALGSTCVVGCSALEVDEQASTVRVGERVLRDGEPVSIDGGTGEVFTGELSTTEPAEEHTRLGELLTHAHSSADVDVLAKVTTPEQARRALAKGASGIVVGVDDVLAAAGLLAEVSKTLRGGGGRLDTARLESVLVEQFSALLAACPDVEVGVRALDVHADELAEVLDSTQAFVEHPQLALPLGEPELIKAQIRALATAAATVDGSTTPYLVVRNLTDPAEAAALRATRDELDESDRLVVGAYVTSPRGALLASEISAHSEMLWLEMRVMQATMFGIAPRHLLAREPLEGYVHSGLLGTDPRQQIDESVAPLLDSVAEAHANHPQCPAGVRLSAAVSEPVAATLYSHGFRRFSVDLDELAPCVLALGKAAFAESGTRREQATNGA
ncbi:pyruvate, phosphate dikinase [Prauserella halophila]|uniref:Pyruvate, phosphate dikinase n=2 Tax=Actinomycetes TaxID=1760 RepID=A0ABN1W5L4_9PSEU|nr:pyruvate, phosphate dikinase [Prauserella halophila]MCP2235790.1 pyruvate phosphate dikinase (EC 2.7.9.1) [Prauserella halophila]